MDTSRIEATAAPSNRRRSVFAAASTAGRSKVLIAGLCLIVLQLLIGFNYVRRGGFVLDDWLLAAGVKLHGFSAVVSANIAADPRRPLAAVYLAATNTVLGTHQHDQLAWVAVTHVAFALALFAVLRKLGLDFLSAVGAAALCLLFPFSDSLWLWATMGQLNLAATLWLCGVLASLHGVEAERRRSEWHVCALACYVASIFLYELTLPLIVISGAVLLLRTSRRRALRWWAIDVGVVGVAVLLVTSRAIDLIHGQDIHQAKGGALHHAGQIGDQGLTVIARAIAPYGSAPRVVVLAAVLLVIAGSVLAAHLRRDRERVEDVRRWLAVAAAGLIVTIAGWLMLVPSVDYYEPLQPGAGNRINLIAGAGIALLAVALARLIAALASDSLGVRRRAVASALTIGLIALVVGGYLNRIGADRGEWERAAEQRTAVLAQLRSSVPQPRPGTTMIVRGFPLSVAPGVPVFILDWDLSSAVQLLWSDPVLGAWPAPPRGVTCGPSGASVKTITPPGLEAPYGRLVLVDVSAHRSVRVTGRAQCQARAR